MCEPQSLNEARQSLLFVQERISEMESSNPKLYLQLRGLLTELKIWMNCVQRKIETDGSRLAYISELIAPEKAIREGALAKLSERERAALGLGNRPAGNVS